MSNIHCLLNSWSLFLWAIIQVRPAQVVQHYLEFWIKSLIIAIIGTGYLKSLHWQTFSSSQQEITQVAGHSPTKHLEKKQSCKSQPNLFALIPVTPEQQHLHEAVGLFFFFPSEHNMRDKSQHSLFELIFLQGIIFRLALFVVTSKPQQAPEHTWTMTWEVSWASYGKMHVITFHPKKAATG